MKLCELTDCIRNGDPIKIFEYDIDKVIYDGANFEAEPATQALNKVLFISADKGKINIGIKGGKND